MFENLPLFNQPPIDAGEERKQDGMIRVEKHAATEWQQAAEAAIYHIAKHNPELSSNDMWSGVDSLGLATPENRAAGPVFRRCAKRGWIQKTDRVITTTRPTRNKGSVAVWRSLLYQPEAAQ